jgi:hypothetical protein
VQVLASLYVEKRDVAFRRDASYNPILMCKGKKNGDIDIMTMPRRVSAYDTRTLHKYIFVRRFSITYVYKYAAV